MSELPFHIQEEIMKRLPVKSLIRFRSVSKAWKSLIDSSEFIAAHCLRRHTRSQHLLVTYGGAEYEKNYVCYIDDDTFPQQRSLPTFPLSVKQIRAPRVIGSSQGLICLYDSHPNFTTWIAVLWNPLIRKSIVVPLPGRPFVGFGVCPVTNDPKLVSITQSSWDVQETNYQCNVMVYTLSSGKWKSLSSNLPTKYVRDLWHFVVTDRFIYWCAILPTHYIIMSFDVTNENFELIELPDSLADSNVEYLIMSKIRESLAMLQYDKNICSVWVMEHGVQRSFTKLFTIQAPDALIVGFTESGIPIMEVTNDDDDEKCKLVVYEPNAKQNNVLEVAGSRYTCYLYSYMETLLLHGRSDCTSY